jgi:hypothetical protein
VTDDDRKKLDEVLDTFTRFTDFLEFTFAHNIIFYLEEWEEYRDKVYAIVENHDDEISNVNVNVGGLILP